MASVAAGFTVGWPGAGAIPSGWERATALDTYHLKGAAAGADPGTAGGADTHTHTDPGHTHTVSSHQHAGGTSGSSPSANIGGVGDASKFDVADTTHAHSLPTSGAQTGTLASTVGTLGTSSNDPPYYTVRWITSLGTPTGIPVGAWCYWDNATLPTGWSSPAAVRLKYLKGAAAGANGGGTGGSSSSHTHTGAAHTHTIGTHAHSGGSTSATASDDFTQAGSTAMATLAHTHTATFAASSGSVSGSTASGVSGSTTAEPPYVKLGIIQNDNGAADFPIGAIGAWNGLLSAVTGEFALCDGTGGTQDTRGKYIKGADISAGSFTGIGGTGGALTHDHTDPSTHTHSAAHTHGVTLAAASASTNGTSGVSVIAGPPTHTHTAGTSGSAGGTSGAATQTIDSANNEPVNKTVLLLKYIGSIDVTITSPTEGETYTTPTNTVTWTLSSGTQSSKRVMVYASDQSTIVYDSGVIADATESYGLPSTSGLRNGQTYYLTVRVVNNATIPGTSSRRQFLTEWTPPTAITGVSIANVGGA